MPELPEVETTRKGLIPHILNQTISQIIIRAPKLRWPIPKTLVKLLPGQQVLEIDRRAKYLLLRFSTGTLIIHLGMSGRLQTLSAAKAAQKHDHVDICFTNGTVLRYTDPRRFGAILWTAQPTTEHKLLKELGPEPFATEFNSNYLLHQAKNKKIAIKNFIMDSKVVVGVGNIYASEALFAAKLDPRLPVQKITAAQFSKLVQHIKKILQAAIAQGGTTLKDFFDSSGKPGYFKQQLKVYGRADQPCVLCKHPIQELRIGQRNTFFCPVCQVDNGSNAT